MYIQNFPARDPPTGPNSVVFTFVGGPRPTKLVHALLREILDPPLEHVRFNY